MVQDSFLQQVRIVFKKMKKPKRFVNSQKWGFEGRGQGSSGIQSKEGQELTTTVVSLITEKSSDHQIVDVTNKGMVNRYLRVFTMFYTTWCATGLHLRHTCPSRYLNS